MLSYCAYDRKSVRSISQFIARASLAWAVLIFLIALSGAVAAFSLSPSVLNVPVMEPSQTFTIDFIAQQSLLLESTNCSAADLILEDNALVITVPSSSIAQMQNCSLVLVSAEDATIRYVMPFLLVINSSLQSNLSISYTDTLLEIENHGNGTGKVRVCTGPDPTGSEPHSIQVVVPPAEHMQLPVSGRVNVSIGDCAMPFFEHTFNMPDIRREQPQPHVAETNWWIVGAVIALCAICIYGARRLRTLLKNTH